MRTDNGDYHTTQFGRREPAISGADPDLHFGADFEMCAGADQAGQARSTLAERHLMLAVLFSISAHAVVFALAAWSANRVTQSAPITPVTVAGPAIQIRILPAPTPESNLTNDSGESLAPDTLPVAPPVITETALQEAITPESEVSESTIPELSTLEQASSEAGPPVTLPAVRLPSQFDLRSAIQQQTDAGQRRSLEILCDTAQQRHQMMDCGAIEGTEDITVAMQNETASFFNRSILPNKADASDPMSTGGRIKAAVDMGDAQLGTTQTRKRLMGMP
jgi:hypothetical protein